MKYKVLFILFLATSTLSAQIRPDQAPEKTPAGTDAIYTQENGGLNKILFDSARMYFVAGIIETQLNYAVDTALATNPDSLRGYFVKDNSNQWFYVGPDKNGFLLTDGVQGYAPTYHLSENEPFDGQAPIFVSGSDTLGWQTFARPSQIDSTRLRSEGDSVLYYYQNGVVIDSSTIATSGGGGGIGSETDPVYSADSAQLKTDIAANSALDLQSVTDNGSSTTNNITLSGTNPNVSVTGGSNSTNYAFFGKDALYGIGIGYNHGGTALPNGLTNFNGGLFIRNNGTDSKLFDIGFNGSTINFHKNINIDGEISANAGTSSTTLNIQTSGTGQSSEILAVGGANGAGSIFAGQSETAGGGIAYRGSASAPNNGGGGDDYLSLYTRVSGSDSPILETRFDGSFSNFYPELILKDRLYIEVATEDNTLTDIYVRDGATGELKTRTLASTVLTGTAAPSVTPGYIGQIFVDTTNDEAYIAVGTTSSDWKQITN